MRSRPTLRDARLLQAVGLLVAVLGLVGFWWNRDVPRTELGTQQRELLGIEEDAFHASFVVAGRDVFYGEGEADPIYGEGGRIVGWDFQGPSHTRGINTDTILYVQIVDAEVIMVAIPRDLFVGSGTRRINGVLAREGSDGLVERVEAIMGVPIDYHAIIDLDIFERVVDALGGVEVNVPERMYYRDVAGGLEIDLQPGPQVLDGEEAGDFVRYRQFRRGDIDRIDNVKRLAYAMLARVKELHVRAAGALPDLMSTYFDQVETNASPALLRRLIPRIDAFEIRSATLPTRDVVRDGAQGLTTDPAEVESFLATTFGGSARAFRDAPEGTLLITDRSDTPGLGAWYRDRLIAYGVPEERLLLREGDLDPSGTRVVAVADAWSDADYYATLLGTGKQQVADLPRVDGTEIRLELVLGGDALAMTPLGAAGSSVDGVPAGPPRAVPVLSPGAEGAAVPEEEL
ncbi:MAG: LCP family protein [Trueperaceae bacterium]|nr:LCP family protein [Trueperaceae bacterium]